MNSTSRSNAIAPRSRGDGAAPGALRTAFGALAGILRLHPAAPSTTPPGREVGPLFDGVQPGRTALVSMLEVEPSLVGSIVATTKRRLVRFDRIVYLTSHDDFRPFRAAKVPFEYWPPVAELWSRAGDLPWPAYLQAKRALLLSKWRPGLQITYGLDVETYLSRVPTGDPRHQ